MSIDDAEHGASIEDAMEQRTIADVMNATFLPENTATLASRSVIRSHAALSRRIAHECAHADGAFVRHELDTHHRDTVPVNSQYCRSRKHPEWTMTATRN